MVASRPLGEKAPQCVSQDHDKSKEVITTKKAHQYVSQHHPILQDCRDYLSGPQFAVVRRLGAVIPEDQDHPIVPELQPVRWMGGQLALARRAAGQEENGPRDQSAALHAVAGALPLAVCEQGHWA